MTASTATMADKFKHAVEEGSDKKEVVLDFRFKIVCDASQLFDKPVPKDMDAESLLACLKEATMEYDSLGSVDEVLTSNMFRMISGEWMMTDPKVTDPRKHEEQPLSTLDISVRNVTGSKK